jgi:hypothetical protein
MWYNISNEKKKYAPVVQPSTWANEMILTRIFNCVFDALPGH